MQRYEHVHVQVGHRTCDQRQQWHASGHCPPDPAACPPGHRCRPSICSLQAGLNRSMRAPPGPPTVLSPERHSVQICPGRWRLPRAGAWWLARRQQPSLAGCPARWDQASRHLCNRRVGSVMAVWRAVRHPFRRRQAAAPRAGKVHGQIQFHAQPIHRAIVYRLLRPISAVPCSSPNGPSSCAGGVIGWCACSSCVRRGGLGAGGDG